MNSLLFLAAVQSVLFPPHPRHPRQGSSDPDCSSLRPQRFSGSSLRELLTIALLPRVPVSQQAMSTTLSRMTRKLHGSTARRARSPVRGL